MGGGGCRDSRSCWEGCGQRDEKQKRQGPSFPLPVINGPTVSGGV
jgi:hypothetical protein